MNGVLFSALDTAQRVLQNTLARFPTSSENAKRRLTPREQIEIYLRMSPDDLARLRRMHGEEGFRNYIQAMQNLIRRGV